LDPALAGFQQNPVVLMAAENRLLRKREEKLLGHKIREK
jgi:hypothetical protein